MELQLISGRFAKSDAEQILTDIFNIKIAFHRNKLGTGNDSEEYISHAEKRINALENSLRDLIKRIQESDKPNIDINAHIEITFLPPISQ